MLNKILEIELQRALNIAAEYKHEYATHDHFFFALLHNKHIYSFLKNLGCNVEEVIKQQQKHLKVDFKHLIKKDLEYVKPSMALNNALHDTIIKAYLNGGKDANEYDFFIKLIEEKDSYGKKLIEHQGIKLSNLIAESFLYCINDNIAHHNNTNVNKLPESEIKKISEVLMEMESQETNMTTKKKGANSESNPNPIEEFCVNLNKKAEAGGIDILVNRSAEIDRVLEILSRRQKNNPLLVGEPGVGKTAIIEGLALRIVQGKAPKEFLNSVVYSLDVGSIVAGTKYRGDFEARIRDLLSELKNRKNIILFIDEIHTIVGAGSTTTASLDASNLLKPALARGEMRCIGSTTFAEFTVKFAKDAALVRRFQKIVIDEPDTSMTLKILEGIKPYYEKYHNVRYSAGSLESAISLSERYIHDRNLPDKAIDLIDETGARKKMHSNLDDNLITEDDIEITISKTLNIPIANIDGSGGSKIKNLEKDLKKVIFGQDNAIKKIVSGVKLAIAGLRAYDEPACAYIFLGPSGTGKTELAINLAKLSH
ncbi:MAG: AAA family ATPase, partial [Rickettsiaceae bacterium]|nr:AAA family ATPase [Rickettsiaceae bacterium]